MSNELNDCLNEVEKLRADKARTAARYLRALERCRYAVVFAAADAWVRARWGRE